MSAGSGDTRLNPDLDSRGRRPMGASWRRIRVLALALCVSVLCVWIYQQGFPRTTSDDLLEESSLVNAVSSDPAGTTKGSALIQVGEGQADGDAATHGEDARDGAAAQPENNEPVKDPASENIPEPTTAPASLGLPRAEGEREEDAAAQQLTEEQENEMRAEESEVREEIAQLQESQHEAKPLLVWWHPVLPGDEAEPMTRVCAQGPCTVAIRSPHANASDPAVSAYLFYGPNFVPGDLPLPRLHPSSAATGSSPLWAVFAEDPDAARLLSHSSLIALFNLTSTFSHRSHRPLTMQHMLSPGALSVPPRLSFAEKSAAGRAAVLLLSMRCGDELLSTTREPTIAGGAAAGDPAAQEQQPRHTADGVAQIALANWEEEAEEEHEEDRLVRGAEEAGMTVDRVSLCNETLLQDPEAVIALAARYKFTIVRDDARCPDYFDQPLFLTLMAGSVPLYFGHPSLREWFPSRTMIVLPTDFPTPEAMWHQVARAASNETLYQAYHSFRALGPDGWVSESLSSIYDKESHVSWLDMLDAHDQVSAPLDEFECFVCDSVRNTAHKHRPVDDTHLFCPCTGDQEECDSRSAVAEAVVRAVSAGAFSEDDRALVASDVMS